MVDQEGREDPTGKSRNHESRGAYQLSHGYDNLLLSAATSCRKKKSVKQRLYLLLKRH